MALVGRTVEEQIFNRLSAEIQNIVGVVALMANLKAESGLNPRNMENSYEGKLNFTDDSYTEAVDNGSYDNFIRDAVGYGIAQWTFWCRKMNLYNTAKLWGVSIGDLEMQVEFLICELKESYPTVWKALLCATDVKEASDIVLVQFENPKDKSDAKKEYRASLGVELLQKYGGVKMSIRQNILQICQNELGVSEPTGDDKYIDWFNKNILKTWSFAMNVAWCHIFTTYVAIHAGLNSEQFPCTAGCDEGMNWFKNRKQWQYGKAYGGNYNPQPGDPIYYSAGHNQSDSTHTGFVISYNANTGIIKATEGNKSNKVDTREIYDTNPYILGFGIINFPDEDSEKPSDNNYNGFVGSGIGTAVCIEKSGMKVRSGPSTSYSQIGSLAYGKSAEVLEMDMNGWLKIVWVTSPSGYAYVSNTKPYFDVILKDDTAFRPTEIAVGDIVDFVGTVHYTSANASKGSPCKTGKAKVTQKYNGKHPYHLIAVSGGGSNVYGWVDEKDIKVNQTPQTGYTPWVGVVTASVLNVRTGPGKENQKVQAWPQLANGNMVDVLGEAKSSNGDTWYFVNIQGVKGYVHSAYIKRA